MNTMNPSALTVIAATLTAKPIIKAAPKAPNKAPKPAAKSAAAKSAGKGTKGETKPAQASTATVQGKTIKYAIMKGIRPSGGHLLKAHTMAFLELSGLLDLQPYPLAYARKVWGDTALKEHDAKFRKTPDTITLTAAGRDAFIQRGAIKEHVTAYMEILTQGGVNDYVKNQAFILKL